MRVAYLLIDLHKLKQYRSRKLGPILPHINSRMVGNEETPALDSAERVLQVYPIQPKSWQIDPLIFVFNS
jgi:hypothetical protein